MSLQAAPARLVALNSSNRQRNANLRTFSIRMPEEVVPAPIAPASPPPTSQTFSHMPVTTFQPSTPAQISGTLNLVAPTVFYNFGDSPEPDLVVDVVIPNNARPFSTQPPAGLNSPRFLLYTVCHSPVATAPVKFIVNGQTIRHWAVDPRPMDVTKLLLGFGQQNWLIIECGTVIVPFTVIGVWAGQVTIGDILGDLEMREKFPLEEVALICPISGQSIDVPVKGCSCAHRECFDLLAYLNTCQALGQWMCPICRTPLPLEDLRLGVRYDRDPYADPEALMQIPAEETGGSEWWDI